jgi:hypothetical protein
MGCVLLSGNARSPYCPPQASFLRQCLIAASALVLTLARRRSGQGSNIKQPLGRTRESLPYPPKRNWALVTPQHTEVSEQILATYPVIALHRKLRIDEKLCTRLFSIVARHDFDLQRVGKRNLIRVVICKGCR